MAASRAVLFLLVVIPVNLMIISRLPGLSTKELLRGTPAPLVAGLVAVGAVAGLQALGLLGDVPAVVALIITLGVATVITVGGLMFLDGSARRAVRGVGQGIAVQLRRARSGARRAPRDRLVRDVTGDPAPTPSVAPEQLAALGPNVIGATGGSGTRVVAGIVREAGMFIGERLNAYEDDLDVADYLDRWINPYIAGAPDGPGDLAGAMAADLRVLVERHCASIPATAPCWGWKEPRSIYLLPFLHAQMPSLRFLHFVRDGRDMALSENQNQLIKHGSAVLGGARMAGGARCARSRSGARPIARRRTTTSAGLGDAYLRVRFEDLCAEPTQTVAAILGLFGLEGDAERMAEAVRPPATLGRWRKKSRRLVEQLEQVGGEGLRRFGYL